MIVLLFVLVMECVNLVNVYVILSGKALIVIFIILVLVRIIVEIEESVDMEDVSVILDLVEISVNLVKHVLIIVIIEEFVDMESVFVSIITWDLLVLLISSKILKTNFKFNHLILLKHKELVIVLMIAIIEECVFKTLVSVKRVILVMTVNLLNQIRENFVKIIAIIEEIV